ncbi:MAG TPA: single-stranded DNA-binding protein [Candidatus Dormibacteraeota bacterium]
MTLNRQGWNANLRPLRSDQFHGGEAMVNKVILVGNLAADPDVKATAAGMYIAKMRLATNTYAGKDESGNRKQHSEFHNLVAFGKLAEFAGQYMKKGRPIYAEGRLHTSSWDDAAGQKRYRTEVVVEEFQFIPGTKKADDAAA